MLIEIQNEEEMVGLADRLALAVKPPAVLFLYGDLGSGKTTLVRGFLRALGIQSKIKSPTYTLVEPYEVNGNPIYHFDLYRLSSPQELEFIGMKEYFTKNSICLIEWPEKGFPLLSDCDLACYIEILGTKRNVRLKARSTIGEGILRRV